MIVVPLRPDHVGALPRLMGTGEPFIRVRSSSDYWVYAELFASTCPVALVDDQVVGAIVAFRSQISPTDVYVQDVVVHPEHRGRGVVGALVGHVRDFAEAHGCTRMYLTSEPENLAAHRAWLRLGFVNVPGDRLIDGISVTSGFKGPGKDRAVYEIRL